MPHTKQKSKDITFKEKSLSFWQLGFMLSAGQGLISMAIGRSIAQKNGMGVAVTSIWIGNFILFFIGLGIISMTGQRSHTIQNIKENFKTRFAILPALVIVSLFILWYAAHIKYPTDLIADFLSLKLGVVTNDNTHLIRLGAILGLICALACMWGISLIKWFNIVTFPVQVLFFIVALTTFQDTGSLFPETWGFSFLGVTQIMLTWLPGTVNLSTFSRHAKSRAHSILSLFFIFVFHSIFQCFFILLDSKGVFNAIFEASTVSFPQVLSLAFILMSFFSVNFLNIYWASIGWESFFKKEQGAKGYAVIGLIGTVVFIFFESSHFLIGAEVLGSIFIATLGIILIFSALVKVLIQHRVRPIDKIDNAICWLFGCTVAVYTYLQYKNGTTAALYGINASLIACALVVFSEELWWSFKKIKPLG